MRNNTISVTDRYGRYGRYGDFVQFALRTSVPPSRCLADALAALPENYIRRGGTEVRNVPNSYLPTWQKVGTSGTGYIYIAVPPYLLALLPGIEVMIWPI